MSEENNLQVWISLAYPFVDEANIFNHSFPSSGIHVSKIILAFHRLAMSTLIMNDADVAMTGKKMHKGIIAFFMVTHAVDELYDGSWLSFIRSNQHRCEIKIIGRSLDICLLFHAVVSILSAKVNDY